MHISSFGTTDVGNIEGVNEGVILDTEHICMKCFMHQVSVLLVVLVNIQYVINNKSTFLHNRKWSVLSSWRWLERHQSWIHCSVKMQERCWTKTKEMPKWVGLRLMIFHIGISDKSNHFLVYILSERSELPVNNCLHYVRLR